MKPLERMLVMLQADNRKCNSFSIGKEQGKWLEKEDKTFQIHHPITLFM